MLTFPSVLLFVNIPGTPATVTQLAKDVCTFLKWAAGKRFFLFSHFREVKGVCHLPKNFGNFDGKCHRVKNVCNFTFVSLSLSFQNSRWQDRYCPELPGSGESFWKIESGTRISTWKISNRRTRQRTRQRTGEPDKKPTWNWTKKSDKKFFFFFFYLFLPYRHILNVYSTKHYWN